MQFPVFPFLGAVLATLPINVLAGGSSSPAPTCVTITDTTGATCPLPTVTCSITPFCPIISESTVTLECGCPSIYHTTICETTCNVACPMSYDTVYIPCPTSISSSSSSPTVTTTTTTPASSSSSTSLSLTGSSSVSSTGSSASSTANNAELATRILVFGFMAILPGVLLL
jgi:hypothetical protein